MIEDKLKNKRICFFIGSLTTGGAERSVIWLASRLKTEDNTIFILTLDDGGDGGFPSDPRVITYNLGLRFRNKILKKPFYFSKRVLSIRKFLKQQKIECVIAFMPQESVFAILASIYCGIKVIIAERTAPWRRRVGLVWSILRSMLYKYSDVQVAQTDSVARWFRSEMRCSNVVVIPNAATDAPVSHETIIDPYHFIKNGEKIILAVGTRPYLKGFDLLVEAFDTLAGRYKDWKLFIVGLNDEDTNQIFNTADLKKKVQDAKHSESIILNGPVGNIGDWYRAAEIFVLSSRTEGFPNVLVEAMASGCAVVAADCECGPKDIISNNYDGLLVNAESVFSLTAGIEKLMTNQPLRQEFAKNALYVKNRFAETEILRRWASVID